MESMLTTSKRFEKLNITDSGLLSNRLEEPTSVNEFEVNASLISIPEYRVVEKRRITTDEERERGDGIEKRNSPDHWRQQSGDWDDTSSVSRYATCDTAATSESAQSIIQRLNSEIDRRRRRLRKRRSMRGGESRRHGPELQESVSPRGFTVEVVERS